MRKSCIIIVFALSIASANAQQPTGMSILEIFDQFAISKSAALSCLKPNTGLDQGYDENFKSVYDAAWQRLRKLKQSDVSNEQITQTLNKRILFLRDKVTKDANTDGCDSKAYRELINLYKYHAVWNPFSK